MMERIAILSDIHGNLTALETVLADIERRGIQTIFNLGDLAGKGPRGAAVIDRCRQMDMKTILGNWDVYLNKNSNRLVTQWHQAQLGKARLAYLTNLPHTIDFWLSGRRVRLFHASQVDPFVRVYEDDPLEKHLAVFTNTEFTGTAVPEPDVVGYGDIHCAYMMTLREHNKVLFNVGSAGNPLDEPTLSYAILEGELESETPTPFGIQIVRLPYDIEAEVAVAREMEMPEWEVYAKELRTAVYRARH